MMLFNQSSSGGGHWGLPKVYGSQANMFPEKNGGEPFLEIIEHPKSRGFRFRYTCEGPSHGGIPGGSSDKNKKTFPAVRICNYQGYARIVVQLVTNEENPRLHPHSLVGKQCQNGICTVQCGPKDMTATFPNLGIQHVTKKNVATILEERYIAAEMQLSSINDGFPQEVQRNIKEEDRKRIASKAQSEAKSIDLAVVRLMFIAYLPDSNGAFTIMLKPVISDAIFDSKAPNAATLKICRMDCNAGSACGGDEVYLLCDKVQKDDIQVKFFEEDMQGNEVWEGLGSFCPTDVHRQFAIVFRTPPYKDQSVKHPVNVQVQLRRRSDGEVSEARPFTYLPNKTDWELIDRKRRKVVPDFHDHISGNGQGKGYPFGAPLSTVNINFNSNGSGGNGNGGDKVREARRPPVKQENPQKGPIDPTVLLKLNQIKQEPDSPSSQNFNQSSPQPSMSPCSLMSESGSPASVPSPQGETQYIDGTRIPMPRNSRQPSRIPQIAFRSQVQFESEAGQNFHSQTVTSMQTVHQTSQQPSQDFMYNQSPSQMIVDNTAQMISPVAPMYSPVDQNQNPIQLSDLETIDTGIIEQAFIASGPGSGSTNFNLQDPLLPASLFPTGFDDLSLASQNFDFWNIESDAGMEKNQPPSKTTGDYGSAFKYCDESLEDGLSSTEQEVPSSSVTTESTHVDDNVESDAAASMALQMRGLSLEHNVRKPKQQPVATSVPTTLKAETKNLNEIAKDKQTASTQAIAETAVVYKRMSLALHDYSVSGDVRMLLVLQRNLTNISDENGDTVLHLAVIHDQLEVLTSILDVVVTLEKKEEILNKQNQQKQTALHIAAMTDNLEAVIELIKFGANPLITDNNGNHVIHIASRHGNADILACVLRCKLWRGSEHADARNHHGLGCFHLATKAKANARKCLNLLHKQQFNVNLPDLKSGRTSLHVAVEENNLVVAGCLVTECDADIDAATYDGYTSLHLASSLNCYEITTLLLACGANPECSTLPPDNQACGEKPIDLATNEKMKTLLNGNFSQTNSLEYETVLEEDDLSCLDSVLRLRLCKLLNEQQTGSDWVALADRLALKHLVSTLKDLNNPADHLLDNYMVEHGTVVGLRSALMYLGRHDAVQILNRAVLGGSYCELDNKFSFEQNDSAIGSMPEEFDLQCA
uniref:NFkBp105 NFkB protein n=1 Tax=Phallusia mammillata TaxID=59560 RepID=A0A6F9DLI8_9ASCI|nr:NFkBp105 NFkB protein [Phallusia mammillata]